MPHQGEDDSPGQGGSNAPSQDQGDDNTPSQAKQHESDGERPPEGGHSHEAPFSGQPLYGRCGQNVPMQFAKCGHVIGDDLLRNYSNSHLPNCPVCEVQQSPSGQSETAGSCDASKPSAVHDRTKIHTERNRVTIPKYQNPSKWDGVTGEVYVGKHGRQRYVVEPEVWNKMTRKEKKRLVWSINVQAGLPPGEKSQQPTNPGNPNHPDHNPSSTASIIRRSHTTRPDPEPIKAPNNKVVTSRNQKVAPRKNRSRRSQAVIVGAPPAAPASQANVTGIETTASANPSHEEDLMSFESSDTEDTASNGVGNVACPARSANSEQPYDLIQLGDTETENTSRNVQTRPSLSQEVREQLSKLKL